MEVNWSHRADYLHRRHGVTVEQANEALADLHALVFDPDYAGGVRAQRAHHRLVRHRRPTCSPWRP